jgi:ABC-type phosphate/phosphonate transport system ATPase subunit
MTATLDVTDLRKQFAIGRPAIDGVSFAVPAGEIVVLLGPSGWCRRARATSAWCFSPMRSGRT